MTEDHRQHDELRDLLTDAVEDVEPEYRLDTIRARTRRAHPRRAWFTAGGAVLAAASVVTAVSVANDDGPRRVRPAGPDRTSPTALYFVGETPAGPRLYREFQQLPADGGPLAALEAITAAHGPDDPDYRTEWPASVFLSVEMHQDFITVIVDREAVPSMAGERTRLAMQQVIYTLQAATGEDLPVHLQPSDAATEGSLPPERLAFEREPQNDILALMSISDPVEGLPVGDSFFARGRANSNEATVRWEVRRGDQVLMEGFTTAAGTVDHLYPWETDPIDVSGLPPGEYTFVASTDDPSGGAEGYGPFTDTRTIIVD